MLKKSVSLILFFSLFFMLLTALVMYVAPPARVASWADWSFCGLSRARWEGAHLGMGLLFLGAGVAHLLLNWDNLLDHLRDRDGAVVVFTKPLFWGLAVCVLVFAGSLAGMPPVSQMVTLSALIKDRATEVYGEPPYSMADRATLAEIARRMGMERDKALALLRLRNIKAESADQTLSEIARQNGVAPGGVFEALKMVMEPSGGTSTTAGLPKDPPPGLGRRKLSDICEEYGLDVKAVMARLEAAGLRAQPAWTLAEVAKASNVLPIAVYETMRAEKPQGPVQVEVPSSPSGADLRPQPVVQSSTPSAPAPAPTPAPQPAPSATVPATVPASPTIPPAPQAVTTPPSPQPQPGHAVQPAPYQPYQPALPHEPSNVGAAKEAQPGYTPPSGYQPAPLPAPAAPSSLAVNPPPGLEKMMLQTYCRENNIPLSTAVQRLGRHHITAFGDMTFEELSLENNRTPTDILRLVLAP